MNVIKRSGSWNWNKEQKQRYNRSMWIHTDTSLTCKKASHVYLLSFLKYVSTLNDTFRFLDSFFTQPTHYYYFHLLNALNFPPNKHPPNLLSWPFPVAMLHMSTAWVWPMLIKHKSTSNETILGIILWIM